MELTHSNLCLKAANYLRSQGIHPFHRCLYSVCELDRVGERPDAFGFGSNTTQLIEVKISKADFLSDRKKLWRKSPELGLGEYRSYLCPEGLIKENCLPDNWGLLYIDGRGKITVVKTAFSQTCNRIEEIGLITSILRREGVKQQTFRYRKENAEYLFEDYEEDNN